MNRFSVIIPHLNSGPLLKQAVQSVLSQWDKDIECIIVDAGSQDASLKELPHDDVRLKVIVEKHCESPAKAINRGILESDGELVGILSSDDVYLQNALAAVDAYFYNNPTAQLLYGNAEYIDEYGAPFKKVRICEPTLELLQEKSCLCSSAVFYKRELINQIGAFDERLQYWMGYAYWIEVAKAGVPFGNTAQALAGKRIHPGNRISGARKREHDFKSLDEVLSMLRERLGDVGRHWPLHLGRIAANAEGHDRNSSFAYDIKTLQRAFQETDRDGETMMQRRSRRLKLVLQHVRTEANHLFRRPKYSLRFLPNAKNSATKRALGRRLFQLRYDEPYACQLPASYFTPIKLDNPPTISIVTPNLNQGAYIERTLRSVLDQGYPKLEFVVQDGCSNDASLDVIRRYAPQLASWESTKDRGQSHAINLGLQRTSGDIMAYLNSDDTLVPGSLACVAEFFQKHPKVDVVYGNRLLIDVNDNIINRWVLPAHDSKAIAWADYIPQETMFWRRRAWDAVGGRVDESFQFAMDWDLILRFRAAGLKFARIPRFLGAFRITDGQKTNQLLATLGIREMNRLRHRELGRIPTEQEVSRNVRGYIRRQRTVEKFYNLSETFNALFYPPVDWNLNDTLARERACESASSIVTPEQRRAA